MTKLDSLIQSRPASRAQVPVMPPTPTHPKVLLSGKALVGLATPCAARNVIAYRQARGLPIA